MVKGLKFMDHFSQILTISRVSDHSLSLSFLSDVDLDRRMQIGIEKKEICIHWAKACMSMKERYIEMKDA